MPDRLTQEEYHNMFTCPAMRAAEVIASDKSDAILEYLNSKSRLNWELSRIGTHSSLYHGWGACMHFQACEGVSIQHRQWWKVEVYVNMKEDKVTLAYQTPGYASRTEHMTYSGFTQETLDDPAKLLGVVAFGQKQKRSY